MRLSHLSPLVVAGLTLAYLLTYPLAIGRADESHLLYGARRVLEGQVIYRDFFEIITPLGFYLFAGIYRVAGTTLQAARVGMAVIEAIGGAALFLLVRRIATPTEAALAVLVFAVLCVPTWPYASAHWISTTLALLTATVLLAERWRGSARARPFLAGLLAGTAICVQQQRGVFLALWLPLALAVLAVGHPPAMRWRLLVREVVWAIGGVALVTALVLGHAAWAASPALVVDALVGFAMTTSATLHTGLTTWAGVLPLSEEWLASTWHWLLRAAPLFLVVESLLVIGHRPRTWNRPVLIRACLCLLAACMVGSIAYLTDFIHVAFVLPFLIIPAMRLLAGLRAHPGWSRVPGGRWLVTGGVVALALALLGQGVANAARAYAVAPERLETQFGSLRTDPGMARLFHAVRRHLVPEPDGRSLLFSYPDDAWLYLALPADDATRFSILLLGWPSAYVDEVLAALRMQRPGTVVVMPLAPGQPVHAAVAEGYRLVEEAYPYRIYVRRLPEGAPSG